MGWSQSDTALYHHASAVCGHLTEGNLHFWEAVSAGCRDTDCLSRIYQHGGFRGATACNRTELAVLHHWGYLYLDDLYSVGDCAVGQRKDRGQWAVVSRQRTEDRSQRSVDSRQRTEGRRQRTVVSGQKAEGSGQKAVVRGQWAEDRSQRTEGSSQKTEDRKQIIIA